jgi:hypothetical protein
MTTLWLTPALLLAPGGPPAARASQEHPTGPHEAAEEAHETEEHHKNALAVFVGGTHAEDQTQGTIGLEYERHLARRVGFVLAFEYAGGEFREYILGAGVAVNPVGGPIFTVGAGLERRPVEEEHGQEHGTDPEVEVASNEAAGGKESLFLFRLGVTYEIELGERWYLAPQFNLDFVDGETVEVFGVSVGFGF